jgi:hypothetical protein
MNDRPCRCPWCTADKWASRIAMGVACFALLYFGGHLLVRFVLG